MNEFLIKLLALLKAKVFADLIDSILSWVRDALIAYVEGLLAERRGGLRAA